jgi:hypothetical protein
MLGLTSKIEVSTAALAKAKVVSRTYQPFVMELLSFSEIIAL